jgi:hypothetical protein
MERLKTTYKEGEMITPKIINTAFADVNELADIDEYFDEAMSQAAEDFFGD